MNKIKIYFKINCKKLNDKIFVLKSFSGGDEFFYPRNYHQN